jgi:hypothetical protein
MTDSVRVRVTLNGKEPKYDLLINGEKILDLSFMDVLNLGLNCTSALRWHHPEGRAGG